MRFILLALVSMLALSPAADAARRDTERSQASSRSQAAAKPARPASHTALQGRGRTPVMRQASRGGRDVVVAARPAPRHAAKAGRQVATRQQASRHARIGNPRYATRGRAVASRPVDRQVALNFGEVRTQRQGLVVRGAAAATVSRETTLCTRRNGRTVCAGRGDGGTAGWQAGLPAVNYSQRDCPAGTFATLARGHDDVVRCMPI